MNENTDSRSILDEAPGYTISGVLAFLEATLHDYDSQKRSWEIERSELLHKISKLEGECSGLQNLQEDLLHRISILEASNSTNETSTRRASLSEYMNQKHSSTYTSPEKKISNESPTYENGNLNNVSTSSRHILQKWLLDFGYDDSKEFVSFSPANSPISTKTTNTCIVSTPFVVSEESTTIEPVTAEEKRETFAEKKNRLSQELLSPVTFSPKKRKDLTMPAPAGDSAALVSTSLDEDMPRLPAPASASSKAASHDAAMADMVEKLTDDELNKLFGKTSTTDKKKTRRMKLKKIKQKKGASTGTIMLGRKTKGKGKTVKMGKPSDWTPLKMKAVATNHLDSIRCVKWHPQLPYLITASEDFTIKIWDVNFLSLATHSNSGKKTQKMPKDIIPLCTLRGHIGRIFTVEILDNMNYILSAGEDGIVYVWKFPEINSVIDASPSTTTTSLSGEWGDNYFVPLGKYVGHSDAIWDIRANPSQDIVLTASSDGSIRLWKIENIENPEAAVFYLRRSSNNNNDNDEDNDEDTANESLSIDAPTCVIWNNSNLDTFFSAHISGNIAMWNINETGGVPMKVFTHELINACASNTVSPQYASKIIMHPTLPLLISCHDDQRLRYWNTDIGECINTVVAHQDAIGSITFNESGTHVISVGHDLSLRVWGGVNNMLDGESPSCMQEMTIHSMKNNDGINDVAYHNRQGWIATAGADCSISLIL